jgi:hypothetical protein
VSASLLAAALAFPAPAANLEIPPKALAQEARTRAAFTPQERARTQALEARLSSKMSVKDVTAMTRGETAGTIFAVMLAYLKLLQKEAREDRKIDQEKEKIEALKREAGERFENAMAAANLEMLMGIVSSAAQAVGAIPTPTATPAAVRGGPPVTKTPPGPLGVGK